jgi:hypothetical protein
MAVRITAVKPIDLPENLTEAHLKMEWFIWVNEQTQESGEASREVMYDWIVNKKGTAYVMTKPDNKKVFVYGAVAANGQKYIRTVEDGRWTDLLIQLERKQATSAGAPSTVA